MMRMMRIVYSQFLMPNISTMIIYGTSCDEYLHPLLIIASMDPTALFLDWNWNKLWWRWYMWVQNAPLDKTFTPKLIWSPVCLVTVRTLALDRVKDETTRTCDRVGMAVHTEVELVANLPEKSSFLQISWQWKMFIKQHIVHIWKYLLTVSSGWAK